MTARQTGKSSGGAPTPGGPNQPTRRAVLKAIGIGGGAVVVTVAAGVGIRGGVNGVWNQGAGAPYALWTRWQDAPGLQAIVAAGVLAANPHNVQPWLFALSGDDTIDVHLDPSRAMPVNDSDERERVTGIGCAIENMIIAARSRSLDATVAAWPVTDPDHVARLVFTEGAPPTERENALAMAIAQRHTNRGPYSPTPVPTSDLAGLADTAPDGAAVVWITDANQMRRLGDLYVEATEAIISDHDMSVEGFSWFRNSRADIDRHRDGLTLDCQGLDSVTLFLAKILPAQSRADGDRFWVNSTRDVHTATAAAYGVIRVPDTANRRDRLTGGRLLEHLHLAATAAGLGFHHMNQITERIARDAAQQRPDRFSQRWADIIGIPAGEGLVSFRIGQPDRPANPSPRRPLHDVLTSTTETIE
jgi:nitroreductase